MELFSGKFPDHFRTGIYLHSKNVLVLLGLWSGARSCRKIYPFYGNTTHSHRYDIKPVRKEEGKSYWKIPLCDDDAGNLIGKFLYAMTMLPGKNNAHN